MPPVTRTMLTFVRTCWFSFFLCLLCPSPQASQWLRRKTLPESWEGFPDEGRRRQLRCTRKCVGPEIPEKEMANSGPRRWQAVASPSTSYRKLFTGWPGRVQEFGDRGARQAGKRVPRVGAG